MKTALFTGIGFATLALATAGSVQANDDFCREYQRRVTIGGKIQDSYGTACLQPDGSWKTVNEGDPQIVGSVAPEPVYVQQQQPVIMYEEEPLYVPYQTTYRSYGYDPSPLWWGVNLSFNDRDRHHGWRDNRGWDRGHGYHGHGGPGRGHHGPGRGHDRH